MLKSSSSCDTTLPAGITNLRWPDPWQKRHLRRSFPTPR